MTTSSERFGVIAIRLLWQASERWRGRAVAFLLAAAFAGWCSTVLASVACAGGLAASHTVRWSIALPTMAGVHMLIGIGEGLITALVLVAAVVFDVATRRKE